MDAIQVARELGKAIQQDTRFVNLAQAQKKNDEDITLQKMIANFNHLRTELTQEAQKGAERDKEKITQMDAELKATYQEIFANENMIAYSAAKSEADYLLSYINQIVIGSASGLNPETIEYQENCGGDCSGCASTCS